MGQSQSANVNDETLKKSIIYLDIGIMIYFSVGLTNNVYSSDQDIVLWIVSPFYILSALFCMLNIKKNFQIKDTMMYNTFIFISQVIGGVIAFYFSYEYNDLPGYILSALSVVFGSFGLYNSKKFFSIAD